MNQLASETDGNFTFEYSPESFHGTEVDYALDVCNAVLDVWQPSEKRKVIINLPTTVENAMPHVFASQVEYMNKHLKYRENVILSLHPHNDQCLRSQRCRDGHACRSRPYRGNVVRKW